MHDLCSIGCGVLDQRVCGLLDIYESFLLMPVFSKRGCWLPVRLYRLISLGTPPNNGARLQSFGHQAKYDARSPAIEDRVCRVA